MAKAKKFRRTFNSRKWLNSEKAASAFIICSMNIERELKYAYADASIKIGDCSRMVTLDFSDYDTKKKRSVFDKAKLDLVISELTAMRKKMDQMVEAADQWEEKNRVDDAQNESK